MDNREAYFATNEIPAGAQVLFAEFSGEGKFYSCTYLHDIVYARYGDKEMRLQIIKPYQIEKKFPLVVYIQGSAWGEQDLYEAIPKLSHVAEKGYVIASVEIRDTRIARFPTPLEDVKCAIRFMRKNADTYGVDINNVAIWGDSSGGHLSLMAGLTIGEYNNGLYGEESDEVCAVVDYFGVSDILTLGKHNDILDHDSPNAPEALLIGGRIKDNIKLAKKASPIHQDLGKKLPAFFIIHGDSDKMVHISQSIEMFKALKENGQSVLFYKVIGGGHGGGIWNPQVLNLTEQFLSANLKRPDNG